MPITHPSVAFCQQMVNFIFFTQNPEELPREFEPKAQVRDQSEESVCLQIGSVAGAAPWRIVTTVALLLVLIVPDICSDQPNAEVHSKKIIGEQLSLFNAVRDALLADNYFLLQAELDTYIKRIDYPPPLLAHYLYAVAVKQNNGDPAVGYDHTHRFLLLSDEEHPERQAAADLLAHFEEKKNRIEVTKRYLIGKVVTERNEFGYSIVKVNRPDRLKSAETVYAILPNEFAELEVLRQANDTIIVAYSKSISYRYLYGGRSDIAYKSIPVGVEVYAKAFKYSK